MITPINYLLMTHQLMLVTNNNSEAFAPELLETLEEMILSVLHAP